MTIAATGPDIAAATQEPRARSVRALSAVNFFLADVRDGLGPFLGIFLIGQGWAPDTIGYVMTIGGIAGMLATTPLGALADATTAKRFMVGFCAVLVIVASLAMLFFTSFPLVAASQVATGVAGAAIGPAIAGLTLGLVGQTGLAHQLGRNEAWNHGGNVVAAVLSGVLGYMFGLPAVFLLMTALAVGSLVSLSMIDPADIDHRAARGLDAKDKETGAGQEKPEGFLALFKSKRLLILAGSMMLFHFGNAAMLPLLGQRVASSTIDRDGLMAILFDPAAYTAITIIIAQATMIPLALLAARVAQKRGYFIVLLAALIALPIRGLLAGLWDNPYAVIPVQMLDGVGAGLLGVAVPGLVAQIMRGTGRVNAGLGAVMTVQGVGASLSPSLAGYIAAQYGFTAAFVSLGAIAVPALLLWIWFGARFRETAQSVPGAA
ncbi:MFS transporter [Aurantimonas sp. Leaf443]|uniref:MFS transporter n=1 Tax=Aurantimonas sp. Leaf443 TaxID=1736378 RepID=UPI0006F5988D|nr:MFS transporter [Aurantimonas sp. Leaf443]KQT82225.1 MFS transporter [Aurantimonas sp. Leaf443]